MPARASNSRPDDVRQVADAGRAVGQRPGLGLRLRYQFGHRVERPRGDERETVGAGELRDRRKILERVVGQVLGHMRIGGVRAGGQQHGVAVGGRAGDALRADDAVGAGARFHDHRLAQRLGQLLRQPACQHVGRAAGGKRLDDLDDAVRICLGCRAGHRRAQHETGRQQNPAGACLRTAIFCRTCHSPSFRAPPWHRVVS